MSGPRIVTIGGGTGSPIVLKGLIQAGFTQINAICAAMDSGGRTGMLRSDERDQVIAISDLLRNLLALIPPGQRQEERIEAFTQLVAYIDGRNRSFGYRFYYTLLEMFDGDYLRVQRFIERLVGFTFTGKAIPVTLNSTSLWFRTESGVIHQGEHELDRYSMSKDTVAEVWIEPQVAATPDAIEAIMQASYIIYCPGSVYGSVIANLLPKGIKDGLKRTRAKKILLTNLVSTRNETHCFTPQKYLRLLQVYTGLEYPVDIFVMPDLSRDKFENQYPSVAIHYAKEHSHFLGWSCEEVDLLQGLGIEIVAANHWEATRDLKRLRHSSDKLAGLFQNLIV